MTLFSCNLVTLTCNKCLITTKTLTSPEHFYFFLLSGVTIFYRLPGGILLVPCDSRFHIRSSPDHSRLTIQNHTGNTRQSQRIPGSSHLAFRKHRRDAEVGRHLGFLHLAGVAASQSRLPRLELTV